MTRIHALTPDGHLPSTAEAHVEELTAHSPRVLDTDETWRAAEVDDQGRISRAVDAEGRTWLVPHPDTPGIVAPEIAGQLQNIETADWAWAIADEGGRVALGIRPDGTLYVGGGTAYPYDVVLVIGQSNAKGQGRPIMTRDPWPGVDQFPALNKAEAGQIIPATEPLLHQGPVTSTSGTGFPIPFARRYRQEHPGRRVLLVPSAYGATGFSTSAPAQGGTWDWTAPDDGTNLAVNAVRQTQAALAAAGPGARLVGILWHQGEGDGAIADIYASKLDGLIAWLRTELDAPEVPFVVGQMSPDRQGGGHARHHRCRPPADPRPRRADGVRAVAAGPAQPRRSDPPLHAGVGLHRPGVLRRAAPRIVQRCRHRPDRPGERAHAPRGRHGDRDLGSRMVPRHRLPDRAQHGRHHMVHRRRDPQPCARDQRHHHRVHASPRPRHHDQRGRGIHPGHRLRRPP
ncbi:hypothetical protein GCM10009793_10150 [Brachybacterium phenoliresistens]